MYHATSGRKNRTATEVGSNSTAFVQVLLPYAYKRTELLLAGHSKSEVIAAIKAAIDKKELLALEPGAVSYMMSKGSYLTDEGGHNGPRLMFYETAKDGAAWAQISQTPQSSP
jgi:hypothetical protein